MQSAPPAGWYPDPSGQQGLRWWDGLQWGPHAPQPATPAAALAMAVPVPGAGPARSPIPWAWGVAAMPVIQLIVGVVVGLAAGMSVGGPGAVFAGVIVAALLGIFMAVKDARALRAAGEPFSSGLVAWCLLSGWAYLLARAIKRVNRTNKDWVLFTVSALTWLVVVVIATPVISSAVTSGGVQPCQGPVRHCAGHLPPDGNLGHGELPAGPVAQAGQPVPVRRHSGGRVHRDGDGHHPGQQRRLHLADHWLTGDWPVHVNAAR